MELEGFILDHLLTAITLPRKRTQEIMANDETFSTDHREGPLSLRVITVGAPGHRTGHLSRRHQQLVVPYPAGGATDVIGRIVADRFSAQWNASVIVENIAGAAANIGMDRVAKGRALSRPSPPSKFG